MANHILTFNSGSSSIKFALFEPQSDGALSERLRGQLDGLGATPRLSVVGDPDGVNAIAGTIDDHAAGLRAILDLIVARHPDAVVGAIGHRVVHGGIMFSAPVAIDDAVLAQLDSLVPLAPLHQPHNLAGIRAAMAAFPDAGQVACFDTGFHRTQPWESDTYGLPPRYYDEGVRRYGFHGLSYEHVAGALRSFAPEAMKGRAVIAHLGNGASMCALRGGRSVASTMGFTTLDGLAMGTRCGQIDPGVLLYLMAQKGMTVDEITELLYRQSGLKGMSGLSQDMRALEAATTAQSQRAIGYFVARVRRELGGLAATLGGLDLLAFCGGIGENAWRVRARICAGFEWMGLALDPAANEAGLGSTQITDISSAGSRVPIVLARTDEERMIASHVRALVDSRIVA